MNPEHRAPALTPRLVVGLLVVGFGLALLFDNLGWFEARDLLRYWPFGLILVGLAKLLQDEARSGRIAGGLLCAVGVLFAVDIFWFVRLDVWRWWPLAIIFFGILIVSRAFNPQETTGKIQVGVVFGGSKPAGDSTTGGAKPGTQDPRISELAIWSGVERRVSSPAFARADLTAIMGSIDFDLRQAGTDQGGAVIEVFAMWGGIEIIVPPDWAVSNQVTPIMGGSNDQSTGTQQARHRLIVKGVAIMGGVDIKT